MLLIALLVFGFEEPDTLVFTVRDYMRVSIRGVNADPPKSIGGSYRIVMITDHVNPSKVNKKVFICLDDVGYLTPVGCTIEVKGTSQIVNTMAGPTKAIVVTSKDQIKILGVGPIEIPEMTKADKDFIKALENRDKQLRREIPKRVPVPGLNNKTGVVLPGGKP